MKKPKDPNRPKKPRTAYFQFIKVLRKNHPGLSSTEYPREAAVAWKALSDGDREMYKEKAAEAKKNYAVIKAEYQKTPEYALYQEKLLAFKEGKQRKLRAQKKSDKILKARSYEG